VSIHGEINAIIRDDDFMTLAQRFSRTNLFQVSGMGSQEIKHSNLLAWLLNPTETHGLGDAFIKGILSRLYDESQDAEIPLPDSIIELLLDDLHDSLVFRESEGNIDLLFRTNDERLIVCIENKVWASVSDHQPDKYYGYVQEAYGKYQNKVFILLTPSGYAVPSRISKNADMWLAFSYASLAECLKDLIAQSTDERTNILIEDYLELLERRGIVDDPDNQLIDRLYGRYRHVFDLVNKRQIAIGNTIEDALKKLYTSVLEELGSAGEIVKWDTYEDIKKPTQRLIKFSTEKMDKYLPPEKDVAGSWEDGTTYRYWIFTNLVAPTIVFELGAFGQPSTLIGKMEAIRSFVQPTKKAIDSSRRYRRIKEIETRIDERETLSPDEIENEEIKRLLKDAIQKMLDFETELFTHLN